MRNINIVVDLDNTLLDATTPHLRYYNQVSGDNFTNADVNDVYLYRLYSWNEEEQESIYNRFGHAIHWESSPYPGAIETLNQLAKQHTITIMTARPSQFRQVTLKWLEHYGAEFHHIMFTEHKYKEFIHLGGDVLVDDAPHYAIEFSAHGLPVVLYNQPYNYHINNNYIHRASNWKEVKTHIELLTASIT